MQVVGVARQVRILRSRNCYERLGVVLGGENRADSSYLGHAGRAGATLDRWRVETGRWKRAEWCPGRSVGRFRTKWEERGQAILAWMVGPLRADRGWQDRRRRNRCPWLNGILLLPGAPVSRAALRSASRFASGSCFWIGAVLAWYVVRSDRTTKEATLFGRIWRFAFA